MSTSAEIKQRAKALAEKTDVNSISPQEVGGIMHDLASHSENVLRNGGTLGIRKVYSSVAAMEADRTAPIDFWGNPIKKGNLVAIYDGTTTGLENNQIYAFMNPGWELATKLDAAYATRSELAELGSNGTDFSRGIYASVNSWLSGISLGGFSSGVKTNNTKRARFNGYITAPFRIETNEGYIIRQITRYEKLNDGTFVYYEQAGENSNTFFVEKTSKYLYTIAFSKVDDTQELNVADLSLMVKHFKGSFSYFEERIDKDIATLTEKADNIEEEIDLVNAKANKYDGNIFNHITLESGSLLDGVPTENNKRCRTVGYINPPFNIRLSSGYRITSIYRYNKSLEYIGLETIKSDTVEVEADDYLYRFAISKVDDTQVIEENEIDNIIESYNNKNTLNTERVNNIEGKLVQTKDIDSLEKREKGVFVSYENGVYNINTDSTSWDSWVLDADSIKNVEATLGFATDLQCNIILFKGDDFVVDNIITHVKGTKVSEGVKYFNIKDIPSECNKIVISNRIANYSSPSIEVESYYNLDKEFQQINKEIRTIKGEYNIDLELGANNNGVPTDSNKRARTKDYICSPFIITSYESYLVKAVYRYEQNGNYIGYETVNKRTFETLADGYLYKIVFSKVDDTVEIATKELDSIVETFKDEKAIQQENILNDIEYLKETSQITIPDVYVTSQRIKKFATYSDLIQAYDALVEEYPNIISKSELGAASDGQMLYEYIISSGNYNREGLRGKDEEIEKPLVLLEAGIHGYEPESNTSLYVFVSDLIKGNLSLSSIRDNCNIKVIPCLNPYGYDHNRRGNANNVDLNRNFEVGWILQGDANANPSYYGGPSAASEAETKIMQEWLRTNKNAVLFIDFHNSSYTNEISCMGGSNELEGMTSFKRKYLIGVHKLSSYLTSFFKIPDSSIWGYSFSSNLAGTSGSFRNSVGIVGGTLETSQNVNGEGANSPITIAVGADVLGTILLSCVNIE